MCDILLSYIFHIKNQKVFLLREKDLSVSVPVIKVFSINNNYLYLIPYSYILYLQIASKKIK